CTARNNKSGNVAQHTDIYLRDLVNGVTQLVSINAAGTGTGNGESMNPQISDDGSLVIFYSGAEDLLPPGIDQNGTWDVYAYNAHTGSMQLVSATAAGTSGNDESFLAGPGTLSPDGRFAVFESQASDLVPEATDT